MSESCLPLLNYLVWIYLSLCACALFASDLIFLYYRPNWEGGQYEGNDRKRFEALLLAMELGAEYVDIELKVILHCIIYACIHQDCAINPLCHQERLSVSHTQCFYHKIHTNEYSYAHLCKPLDC